MNDMDYKVNPLTIKLVAEENLTPEINGLRFATLGDDKILFDYDAYFEANELEYIDYKTFSRACKHFIESYAKLSGFQTSQMFYKNADGHLLVIIQLVYLFLCFVNPEMLGYLTSLVNKAMTEGVAYSQGFIFDVAARNLPTDVLEELINMRKEAEETEDNG